MALDLEVASRFVKGRIGEEIINQCFSAYGYQVSPIGIEHGNLMPVYNCKGHHKDLLFHQTRRSPDFCLTIDGTFRYIEAKYRAKEWTGEMDQWVISTILESYYRVDGSRLQGMHHQFRDVVMIWMFRNEVRGFRLGTVATAIDRYMGALPSKVNTNTQRELIRKNVPVNWSHGITAPDHKDHTIRKDHWDQFTNEYQTLIQQIHE